MINGMINVYKEPGYTSRDAVSRLSGILRQRKIGHTGTLDPAAEGVLPMCIGNATKLCELLTDGEKEYRAVMKLGLATDTEDTTGEILSETSFDDTWYQEHITEESVTLAAKSFLGKILQIPPMYSAKKVDGKRLYEFAREGKVIERKPCEITIHEIRIENVDPKEREVTLTVRCSKGTYIRTLCKDLGEKLGTKAAMKSLLRTKTGKFSIDTSRTLDEIETLVKEGRLSEILLPVENVFSDLPKITACGYTGNLLSNGAALHREYLLKEHPCLRECKDGDRFRMYHEDVFKAVYQYDEKSAALKVYKMF